MHSVQMVYEMHWVVYTCTIQKGFILLNMLFHVIAYQKVFLKMKMN